MPFTEDRDRIIGLWRLIEYADRESESGPWRATFGANPSGLILYHPSGQLAVQVSAANDEDASVKYAGYYGTYRVRVAERDQRDIVGTVEHHMEAAFPTELLDEHFDRPFRIDADRPALGDGRTSRNVPEFV